MNQVHPRRRRCSQCSAVYQDGYECCVLDGNPLEACPDEPLIGTIIAGRYVLEELVGEGSMGLVYRARHLRLARTFAIKVLPGDLGADPRMRLRFAREAAAASLLDHPNVVPVVDFGRSDAGFLYLVMHHVQGETLRQVIEREAPMAPARAVDFIRQLAQGLDHAHEHGLVHRDFKPDNVMLDQLDGAPLPRILDFGLAISDRDADSFARVTETGVTVGTPMYIAPEQILEDAPVDHRADLFALGCVFHEMLTGAPPLTGRPADILRTRLSQPAPPIEARFPHLQPALAAIVMRLLEREPGDRFQSAAELIAALDAFEPLAPPPDERAASAPALITDAPTLIGAEPLAELLPPVAEPERRIPRAAVITLVAAAALGAIAAPLWSRLDPDPPRRPRPAAPLVRAEVPADTSASPIGAPAPTPVAPPVPVAAVVPAPRPVKAAPAAAPVDDTGSPEQLLRDYREVGAAIDGLGARDGATELADRYLRISLADALKVPALRRQAIAELAALRASARSLGAD